MERDVKVAVVVIAVALAAAWLVPLPARLDARESREVRYKDGSVAYVTQSADDRYRLSGDLAEIDPRYVEALLRYEDKRFYSHVGIDPIAIVRALFLNVTHGRVVSGASTLTLQLVRVLEPRPRTFSSKLVETLRAMQIELRLSKREVLEAYLRFAPFGKNVEGVRAAAFAYFGHDARALTPGEIAYLVSVPQDPNRRYPRPENAARMAQKRDAVAQRIGMVDAIGALLPTKLSPFPRELPHVSLWLLRQHPGMSTVHSALDRGLARLCERTLSSYEAELRRAGIHNGSVVVVDVTTGAVVAAIGNLTFDDAEHHGEVAGFLAPRSTGSTLKPLIYARAIDEGRLLPSYRVLDVPVSLGGYEPKNYDDRFRGLVRIDEALSQSLNIPFVNLLHEVGVDPFLAMLEHGGISTLGDHRRYGLSAALGGIDASLVELTGLYAALAGDGRVRALSWLDGEATPRGAHLFGAGAAHLTRRALSGRDRPDFPLRRSSVVLAPSFFWKTGTSYGHRDAWAIGSDRRFAIGVWLGNFDGTPAHALVGGERAGPILFDLFDALSNRHYDETLADVPPEDLSEVEVCALSGMLAEPHCPHKERTWGKTSDLPAQRCSFHREVEVDTHTGHATCPLCRTSHSATRVLTVFPASARRYIDDARAEVLPEHTPSCQVARAQAAPRIRSPHAGTTFFLMPGLSRERQRIPLEVDGPDDASLDWFVDGEWFGPATPHRRQWLDPRPGRVVIRVVDKNGHADAVAIDIKEAG